MMKFEEVCGEFEQNIEADKGGCKSNFRGVIAFVCLPSFFENEILIKDGWDHTRLFANRSFGYL
ncbi:MAG: hypothetical protein GX416_14440 [Bacteroidales bacterium]|nr:hypothetical protein [Bacteroidales bacterium]